METTFGLTEWSGRKGILPQSNDQIRIASRFGGRKRLKAVVKHEHALYRINGIHKRETKCLNRNLRNSPTKIIGWRSKIALLNRSSIPYSKTSPQSQSNRSRDVQILAKLTVFLILCWRTNLFSALRMKMSWEWFIPGSTPKPKKSKFLIERKGVGILLKMRIVSVHAVFATVWLNPGGFT